MLASLFMDDRISQVAALANVARYDAAATARYVDGAPHIKHRSLRSLYGRLLVEVFDRARQHTAVPRVLDLGAGEGSVTLPCLELGAHVVAIDSSESQIDALRRRCAPFGSRLDARCEDVNEALDAEGATYDIVIANSFLHHVPDFMDVIRRSALVLGPHGQFFSFQDPLRYDTLPRATIVFDRIAYVSWRLSKGDVFGGLMRRVRRARGVYCSESVHDNAEYHVVRNGVDQAAIAQGLRELGFECRIERYFSTQSRLLQRVGSAMGLENTFAVVARRP